MSNVPKANTIKLYEPHIVSINFADNLTIYLDFSLEVVFWVRFDTSISDLVKSGDSVCIIYEINSTGDLMDQGTTPQCILKRIRWWVEGNFGAVLEDDFLVTLNAEVDRIEMGFRGERTVGAVPVETIWTFKHHVADRRMMTDLLKGNFGAIFHSGLVCFT